MKTADVYRQHMMKDEDDSYDKRLVETESTASDVTKSTHLNSNLNQHHAHHNNTNHMYHTTLHKKHEIHHHIVEDTDSGAEMYSLDDLPRVSSLNDEEVHSIDSSILMAEERALGGDTSSAELDLSGGSSSTARYRKNNTLLSPDDYNNRRMSQQRRSSAVSAARRLSNQENTFSERTDRKISVVSEQGYGDHTPSTLRREVSAFGEITVMPVGDSEDEDLKVAVEEEVIR